MCQYTRLKGDVQKLNADSLRKWSEKNPKWFATMVGLTYLKYRNLYLLDEHDIGKFGVNGKVGLYDEYIRVKQFELNEGIERYFTGKNEELDRSSYHFFELIKLSFGKIEQWEEHTEEQQTVLGIYRLMEKEYSKDSLNNDYKIKYLLFLMEKGIFPQKLNLDEITRENSDVQLETLMNYLKSMLVSYSRLFKIYSIKDVEKFGNDLRDMGYTRSAREYKPYIDTEQLDSIYYFVKKLYLKKRNLQSWETDNINVNLEKWPQIINQVQLFIPENKKENIKTLIALWESINYMQEYYIPLYIRAKEDITAENREESFSKKFYDEVQEILKMDIGDNINGDSYFRALVLNQMERSGREYYNRIAKKGTRDDE